MVLHMKVVNGRLSVAILRNKMVPQLCLELGGIRVYIKKIFGSEVIFGKTIGPAFDLQLVYTGPC